MLLFPIKFVIHLKKINAFERNIFVFQIYIHAFILHNTHIYIISNSCKINKTTV